MKTKNRSLYFLMMLVLPYFFEFSVAVNAQDDLQYQKPPKEILDLVDIKAPPIPIIDKNVRYIVFLERPTFKSLSELAENELRIGGIRLNTQTFNASRSTYFTGITIQNAESGNGLNINGLPEELNIVFPSFSPEYNYFSFANVTDGGLDLWIIELKNGTAKKISNSKLSGILGRPFTWSPDEKFLYCYLRNSDKPNFKEKELPKGPAVQESAGTKAPVRTYQDLLKNNNDETKFEYYASRSVSKIYLDGKESAFLPSGIYKAFEPSPDGKYIMTEEVNKPFSYQVPYYQFPYAVNVYDNNGKFVRQMDTKPLQDIIPISFDAVESGRRDFMWRGDKPAILVWCEAQDGGDPSKPAEKRDRVYQLNAPFDGNPVMLCATLNRFSGITWGDNNTAIAYDRWRKNRNRKTYLINPSTENENPKILFDGSSEDLYNDPGRFVTAPNQFNENTLLFSKDKKSIYLTGEGYSTEGNRPFLNEYNLNSGKINQMWRADGVSTYESIAGIIDINKNLILTRIESPVLFPNYYIRNFNSKKSPKQITYIENPYKSFENVSKQKIFYKRQDGVDLSATLYLPAGYDKSQGRLPMLMEAYPTEYKDPKAAGQLRESPYRFVSLSWSSPVFWAARGFAILQNAQFPIIGKGTEEPNDTYIEQLVANARAAIQAVDTMGIVDAGRVAVMGHSYGAFMTANLLAHSDLFAAGIARSGAYNRTLTPFGFQAEERTYWQAKDVYDRMSPFTYADKIKTPLLMIHGEADNNSGTFPIQSERLFQAVKGLGGTARLVFLPFEAHSYAAKENILHMLWEMDSWLDKYVKNKN